MPKSEFEEFTDDLKIAIASFLNDALKNADFKSIYNKATAAYKVLTAWAPDNQELLGSAAGAAKRAVMLVCIRQYSLVNVELRRFIECIIWYTFFSDHPVEWEMFKDNPGRSWKKKPEKPIETAASAPTNYYFRYLQERMTQEPSGLAKQAIDVFRNEYDTLSMYIHGAKPAIDGTLALAFDREDPEQYRLIKNRCYNVLKSGCIVVAALKKELLNNLSTTERKYFDKLVSPSTARKIREQPFGLQ